MTATSKGIQLVIKAAHFAADKHRNQRRKDACETPYINHPLTLAKILSDEAGIVDPEVIAAAILHDTIEDTQTTESELRLIFGDAIADTVLEVTDDKSLPKSERKRLQIVNAPHKSEKSKLVKIADKIANLRDLIDSPPSQWPLERRKEYFDWAKSVVDAIEKPNTRLKSLFDEAYSKRPC